MDIGTRGPCAGPATCWILVTTLVIVMAPHALLAQSLTNQQLLERIELLEAQLAELKSVVRAQPASVHAPGAEAPKSEAVKTEASPSLDYLRDLKYGGSLDTYYLFNFDRPVGRVNLLRAYDVTSNNFSLNQASVVLESVPDAEAGRRFGGRVDLQYGQATETLQGNLANEPRPWVYRNIFQAFGTYVFPLGSGLTVDFGKWASSLGLETNYTKDQWNYSRSYWFDYLPFYHMGARVSYRFNDAVAVNYWLTNGVQQTETFKNYKDQLFGAVINPVKSVTWTTNFYMGQEHPDVQQILVPGVPSLPTQPALSVVPIVPAPDGRLHILDSYATWQATQNTAFSLEGDYVVSRLWNEPGPGRSTAPSHVYGGAVYARHQVTPKVALAARGEYLRDDGGLFSGVTQSLKETTLTYEYKVSDGFLMRAEWRRDVSNLPFFLTRNAGVLKANQDTATIGMIWWWGNKRGAW
ncbi:MAG TPA: outer membrane beta-barrel protein [Vicinamibacterales bacterium]|nr:outer membrane beta-barrel protein [Vicinamibacterales bacterium]